MLFSFLLVVQFIIAFMLVVVILMQKSEGGGLTTGGSPSGLMSARGAADFLTRATSILGTLFIVMSIILAVFAANRHSTTVDTSLQKKAEAPAAVPTAPADSVPLGIPGNTSGAAAPSLTVSPTTGGATSNSGIPAGQ
jgi:preprotein translocase subunit SecG